MSIDQINAQIEYHRTQLVRLKWLKKALEEEDD